MRIFGVNASVNSHENDAYGAFIPEAKGFAKERTSKGDQVEIRPFDNSSPDKGKRRALVLGMINNTQPFDAFIYFGHGLRTGLPSAGFTLQTLESLAQALHAKGAKNLRVMLYACSTGESPNGSVGGDGGFADLLRDRLSVLGHTGWVDAHTVPGHTTINRMTRRFYMDGKAAGTGGTWLVAPGSPEWPAWGRLLKNDKPFRFGFPFMTEAEIHARLAAG